MADDDKRLLDKARRGDAEALRSLLERFGGEIWREIDRTIGQPWRALIDADDVMQVTYMEAFLEGDRLSAEEPAAFVAWLRRIAQNNLRDAIKELQRKKRPNPKRRIHAGAGEESYVALIDLLGATSATPSRHAAAGEAARIIDAVLERMPPDYRKVVRLYDLEERDIGEVAEAMGRSAGAIHMLRARAHDRLRRLLSSESDFFTHTA